VRTYILRRLAISLPILLGLTLVTFVFTELMPGDFVDSLAPPTAIVAYTPEQLEAMRENYGLNKPPYERYVIWLWELARGNLGHSLVSGAPVRDEILARLPATLQLTVASLFFGIIVGGILGVIAAVKQYSWMDQLLTILGFFWISTPGFVFAIAGVYLFSLKFPLFPTSGITDYGEAAGWLTRIHHMILPAAVLGLGTVASFMRYTRGSMLEVIRQDYITVARAKGLAEKVILLTHALRNALIPVITIIGLDIPFLIGGAVIINARDYPVIMGVNFMVALVVLLSNLLTDITYAFADPRIRYE
jgi:peptide/nickel transport system permease protein